MPGSTASAPATGRRQWPVWVGVLLIGLTVSAYVALPQVIGALAPRLAPALGLESLSVQALRPGWGAWRWPRVVATAGGWRITAHDVSLGYTPFSLLRGRLDQVEVVALGIHSAATDGTGSEPGPLPDVAGLFAALPARRVDMTALTVDVPAAGFAALGRATVADDALALALHTTFPDPVGELDLSAELTADGAFRLDLAPSAAAGGPAPLRVVGALAGDHIAIDGRFALDGPVLDLLRVATGVAPGGGALRGHLEARVPWPPGPDGVAATAGSGTVTGDWQDAAGRFAVTGLRTDWSLRGGDLAGTASATVAAGGFRLPLRVELARWPLHGGEAEGSVTVGVHGASAAEAVAAVRWQLSDGGLRVTADAAVDDGGWAALTAAGLALPGQGALTLAGSARLPWPLPADPLADLEGAGTLGGRWRDAAGDLVVHDLDGTWTVSATALSGAASAALSVAGYRGPLQLTLGRWSLTKAAAAGEVRLGVDGVAAAEAGALMRWRLDGGALTVDGAADLRPGGWATLATLWPALPGSGALTATAVSRLPWPLPDGFELADLPAEGRLQGRWSDPELDVAVEALSADWRWRRGVVAGRVTGSVAAGRLRVPLAAEVERLTWQADAVTAGGSWGLEGDPPAPFTLGYRVDSGRATLKATAERRLRGPLLGALVADWREPYDLTGGRLRVQADLGWDPAAGLGGELGIRLDGVAGHAGDTEASGITADLTLSSGAAGWTLQPTSVRAALVDPGVPISDLSLRLGWASERVTIADAQANLLGGRARSSDFDYRLADGSARFDVDLAGLDLARVLALEGEHFTGTGTLSGTLPVTLAANLPSVAGGRITAAPPGGLIRVAPALAAGIGQPGLDFALRALQNFAYTELDADVDYAASGDLTLAVRLKGRNPDVESGRPIHYNLTLRENVPVLLESLRLQDRVTERIERRVTN